MARTTPWRRGSSRWATSTSRPSCAGSSRAHRGRVVQFERPGYSPDDLARAHAQTLDALHSDAEVVYQATFFDGGFVGHADFLERTADGWLVSDTKLARTESVPALLQIAAYAALLREAGVPTAPVARLVVGSGDVRDFALDDIVPVYLARRARLDALLLADHDVRRARRRGATRCGSPAGGARSASPRSRPPATSSLVAGVRGPTRRKLHRRGRHDHRRARRAHRAGGRRARGDPRPAARAGPAPARAGARPRRRRAVRGHRPRHRCAGCRAPSPGDVFFDFEGDPLWSERGSTHLGPGVPLRHRRGRHRRSRCSAPSGPTTATRSGRPSSTSSPGSTRRRRRWPDLHVYHYAPYETAALLRLAARHGVCEDEVDQLLRDGVFVDLYAVVRSAIRVSQRSYSIKKLEPLYMEAREAAVTNAADSIVVYHQFMAARVAERHDEAGAAARRDRRLQPRRLRLDVAAARLAARPGRGRRAPAGRRRP